MVSRFQEHVERWKDCTACDLCQTRNRIVLARGTVPCDVLFIGEAPGESENVLGRPFVGPAGQLLDRIIKRSISEYNHYQGENGQPLLTHALTNLVCCIPRDPETGGKTAEPEDESIEACKPRLQEFVSICHPRLIVTVGRLAGDWLTQGMKYSVKVDRSIKQVAIVHPASILRANIANQGLAVQRCVVAIKNAIEEL